MSLESRERCIQNAISFFIMYVSLLEIIWLYKAEIPQVGTFFRTQFPSLGIFIHKHNGPTGR